MHQNEFCSPAYLKELNKESYEVKISFTVLESDSKGNLSINFSTITLKNQPLPYVKLSKYD